MTLKSILVVLSCYFIGLNAGLPKENMRLAGFRPFTRSVHIPDRCNLDGSIELEMQEAYRVSCRHVQQQMFTNSFQTFCPPKDIEWAETPTSFWDYFRLGLESLGYAVIKTITEVKNPTNIPTLPVLIEMIQSDNRITPLCKSALSKSLTLIQSDADNINAAAKKWAAGITYEPFLEQYLNYTKTVENIIIRPLGCNFFRKNSSLVLKWGETF